MPTLPDDKTRTDLLNRLRRAEGQLRGVQRMVEEGQPRLEIAGQLAAVRKALDSAYLRLTMTTLEQELGARMAPGDKGRQHLGEVLGELRALLDKLR